MLGDDFTKLAEDSSDDVLEFWQSVLTDIWDVVNNDDRIAADGSLRALLQDIPEKF